MTIIILTHIISVIILIYIISVIILLIYCYIDNKHCIRTIRDLFDKSKSFMYIPVLNTGLIVVVLISVILFVTSRLNILWEKFRNIKLK